MWHQVFGFIAHHGFDWLNLSLRFNCKSFQPFNWILISQWTGAQDDWSFKSIAPEPSNEPQNAAAFGTNAASTGYGSAYSDAAAPAATRDPWGGRRMNQMSTQELVALGILPPEKWKFWKLGLCAQKFHQLGGFCCAKWRGPIFSQWTSSENQEGAAVNSGWTCSISPNSPKNDLYLLAGWNWQAVAKQLHNSLYWERYSTGRLQVFCLVSTSLYSNQVGGKNPQQGRTFPDVNEPERSMSSTKRQMHSSLL